MTLPSALKIHVAISVDIKKKRRAFEGVIRMHQVSTDKPPLLIRELRFVTASKETAELITTYCAEAIAVRIEKQQLSEEKQ